MRDMHLDSRGMTPSYLRHVPPFCISALSRRYFGRADVLDKTRAAEIV